MSSIGYCGRPLTIPHRHTALAMSRLIHSSSSQPRHGSNSKGPGLAAAEQSGGITEGTSSAVKAARQSWMLAGFVLALNQLLMPPLLSFTSGRLSPRNTSYLRAPAQTRDQVCSRCLDEVGCRLHCTQGSSSARRQLYFCEAMSDHVGPQGAPVLPVMRFFRSRCMCDLKFGDGCALGEARLALVAHDVALQLAAEQLHHRRFVARQVSRPQPVRLPSACGENHQVMQGWSQECNNKADSKARKPPSLTC